MKTLNKTAIAVVLMVLMAASPLLAKGPGSRRGRSMKKGPQMRAKGGQCSGRVCRKPQMGMRGRDQGHKGSQRGSQMGMRSRGQGHKGMYRGSQMSNRGRGQGHKGMHRGHGGSRPRGFGPR